SRQQRPAVDRRLLPALAEKDLTGLKQRVLERTALNLRCGIALLHLADRFQADIDYFNPVIVELVAVLISMSPMEFADKLFKCIGIQRLQGDRNGVALS